MLQDGFVLRDGFMWRMALYQVPLAPLAALKLGQMAQ